MHEWLTDRPQSSIGDDVLKEALQAAAAGADSRTERAGQAFDLAASWLFSTPMRQLLELFGESMPEGGVDVAGAPAADNDWLHLNEELPSWLDKVVESKGELGGQLQQEHIEILRRALAIERIAADHFDFRGRGTGMYRERAQAASAEFSDELRAAIFDRARQLGLVDADEPQHRQYDMVLVLGGGYKSPQLRAQLAAELQASGIDLGALFFLGSPRFLIADPAEAPQVMYYAEDPHDEFDLMGAGACREFQLTLETPVFLCGCASSDDFCPQWLRLHRDEVGDTPSEYTHERKAELIDMAGRVRGAVLSASTHRPPYRPDTTDTFALWARVAQPEQGQRALIVTTQVFVPFQTFDGVKRLYLDHGVEVDAVGFGADWGDRPLTAEYLLQETLSAIRSARRLLVDATDILRKAECA
jgi:hypothetical protein